MQGLTGSRRRHDLRRIALIFGIGIFFISLTHLLAPISQGYLIDRFAAVASAIALGLAAAAMTYGLFSLLKQRGAALLLVTLPSTAAVSFAIINIRHSPHWLHLSADQRWIECLFSIPLIAALPFALTIWLMRRNLQRQPVILGALAGQVSGTLSAIGYAIHCAENAGRFELVWYGGTIAIFALAGAAIGSTRRHDRGGPTGNTEVLSAARWSGLWTLVGLARSGRQSSAAPIQTLPSEHIGPKL